PERPEAGDVLAGPEARAGGDFALLRDAIGQVVQDRDAGDIVESLGAFYPQRGLADHEHQLRLVIELGDARRPLDARLMTDQAGVELHERRGLLRVLADE